MSCNQNTNEALKSLAVGNVARKYETPAVSVCTRANFEKSDIVPHSPLLAVLLTTTETSMSYSVKKFTIYHVFATNNGAFVRNACARNEVTFSNLTTKFIMLGPQILAENESTHFSKKLGFSKPLLKLL